MSKLIDLLFKMCKDYLDYKANISILGIAMNEINTFDLEGVEQGFSSQGSAFSQSIEIAENICLVRFTQFILNNVSNTDDQVKMFLLAGLNTLGNDLSNPMTMLAKIKILTTEARWDWDNSKIYYMNTRHLIETSISFEDIGKELEKQIPDINQETTQILDTINFMKNQVTAYSTNIISVSGSGMITIEQTNEMLASLQGLLKIYQDVKSAERSEIILRERFIGVIIAIIMLSVITGFMVFLDNVNRLTYLNYGRPIDMS